MTLLLIKRVPSGAEGPAATLFMAGHLWRTASSSPQNTWSSVFCRSHVVPWWPQDIITLLWGFFYFKEAERMRWPCCSLPGEVFLLHEAVGMCCTLSDNMGMEGVDEQGVNLGDCVGQGTPELAKFRPSCPVRGILEWTVSWTFPGTEGRCRQEKEGLQKGSSPSSRGSVHCRTSAAIGRT